MDAGLAVACGGKVGGGSWDGGGGRGRDDECDGSGKGEGGNESRNVPLLLRLYGSDDRGEEVESSMIARVRSD
jgi:hypothetical protein